MFNINIVNNIVKSIKLKAINLENNNFSITFNRKDLNFSFLLLKVYKNHFIYNFFDSQNLLILIK